jgi:hypothetical protein
MKRILNSFLWIPAFAGMTVGFLVFSQGQALANNIAVSSVSITSQSTANQTANVQFNGFFRTKGEGFAVRR